MREKKSLYFYLFLFYYLKSYFYTKWLIATFILLIYSMAQRHGVYQSDLLDNTIHSDKHHDLFNGKWPCSLSLMENWGGRATLLTQEFL